MYQDYGADLRDIVTAVTCPDCGEKFTVRLSVDFLSRHQSQEIEVICSSCATKQISRGRAI